MENLIDFVQRGNDNRKKIGEVRLFLKAANAFDCAFYSLINYSPRPKGFTFLQIPRSYYGTLSVKQLTDANVGGAGISLSCANAVMNACEQSRIMSLDGAVDLDMTREEIDEILCSALQGPELKEYVSNEAAVLDVILHSRYVNLYKLLRHHLSEESYLGLVRNQILVDVQVSGLACWLACLFVLSFARGEAVTLSFIHPNQFL